MHQFAVWRVSNGSDSDAKLFDRHGRTCSDTGRKLRRFVVDKTTVSINGKRYGRSTAVTGRQDRRPWRRQRAINGHRSHSM
jgi:hypothetical protein